MASTTTFTALIEPRPRGGVAIKLPFDPAAEWGGRDRYDVTGAIDGRKVRGKLTPRATAHYLELGPAWCRDAGMEAGGHASVSLSLEGPQLGTIGPDFAAALAVEPDALRFFESLPTFYRKNFMRWIDAAKRPETRANHIAEVIVTLKAHERER